jgi:cold shock CspA family protein
VVTAANCFAHIEDVHAIEGILELLGPTACSFPNPTTTSACSTRCNTTPSTTSTCLLFAQQPGQPAADANNAYRYIEFATANQFYLIAKAAGVDYRRVSDAMHWSARPAGPCQNRTHAPQQITLFNHLVYNGEKGFGFIVQDRGGKDVFVHATTLGRGGLSGLTEGQRVRMQIGQGQKGPEARSIELLD